jgi:hypothetical protein
MDSADIGFDIVNDVGATIVGSNGVERIEDARLIAAAPELLEVCKLFAVCSGAGFVYPAGSLQQLYAAIAKATA